MTMQYFDLFEDVYLPGRWELGTLVNPQGEVIVPGLLMRGEPYSFEEPLKVPIDTPGRPTDFSHAAFAVPVVSARIASIFTQLAPNDVQLIPVSIEAQQGQHFILNALRIVKCIDDRASEEVQYWAQEDGLPEKVGTYFSVLGMRLDVTKVGDAKVFRTWGWTSALIISGDIKEALERAGATGAKFKDVTGPRQSPA